MLFPLKSLTLVVMDILPFAEKPERSPVSQPKYALILRTNSGSPVVWDIIYKITSIFLDQWRVPYSIPTYILMC